MQAAQKRTPLESLVWERKEEACSIGGEPSASQRDWVQREANDKVCRWNVCVVEEKKMKKEYRMDKGDRTGGTEF